MRLVREGNSLFLEILESREVSFILPLHGNTTHGDTLRSYLGRPVRPTEDLYCLWTRMMEEENVLYVSIIIVYNCFFIHFFSIDNIYTCILMF